MKIERRRTDKYCSSVKYNKTLNNAIIGSVGSEWNSGSMVTSICVLYDRILNWPAVAGAKSYV